ncbi:MAG: tRNA lysidine(34) synthetase TilS [Thioalkalispiraceae bacterium]|jgi:tRNA(Ile)-lysidine synthase
MELTTAYLQHQLQQWPQLSRYCVAFSGGVDSHVLLHLLSQLHQLQPSFRLRAIHIDHGLHPDSSAWAAHCQQVCDELAVPLEIIRVEVNERHAQGLEAAAREARYSAFRQCLGKDEGLLMAHHQDDQAETLLLQLFRGAGVAGLAAMPGYLAFEQGALLRPLLALRRTQLVDYAKQHQLDWVDDPSNLEARFDRNFLRHQVIPTLTARWPALSGNLSRVAAHQAEAAALLDELAQQDHQHCMGELSMTLSIKALAKIAPARQRNLLRYWLKQVCQLPLPDSRHLQRILDEVLPAAPVASPQVAWADVEVRRYRDGLYAHYQSSVEDLSAAFVRLSWPNPVEPLLLPDGTQLTMQRCQGQGLKQASADDISVGYRQGGESCRPLGRGHRHSLKKLMQEWGVPPWQRGRIPLIFVGDELAQVVGYCLCEPFQAGPDEIGVFISQTAP